MKQDFSLTKEGYFVIDDYQNKPTFASFLPGIAGKLGIPLWAFYVNRGQGLASFGIESKEHPIMEFYPANKSYQNVETKGFRTFIKIKNDNGETIYEPFRKVTDQISTKMTIAPYKLTIEEENLDLGLKVQVNYFILPNENFGALIRRVKVKNIADSQQNIEVLDGMPMLIPYGISNGELKEVSQTISAWTKVYAFADKTPFYRLRASAEDEAEVSQMEAGNFYIPFTREDNENKLLQPLVDPKVIFENRTSLEDAVGFNKQELTDFKGKQILENRFPAAMSATKDRLAKGEELEINSAYGHLADQDMMTDVTNKVLADDFLDNKAEETAQLHNYYADHIFTVSGEQTLDAYSSQTFMDNILRGGFPTNFGEESETTYHIFSRKHGDLERDYNEFSLEPAYYSQGNGNFRDVNQNRRCDVFFNPQVKDHNVKLFANLIQPNGYNPLVIEGSKFYIEDEQAKQEIISQVARKDREMVSDRLEEPFTPGAIAVFIDNHELDLKLDISEFVDLVIDNAEFWTEAQFGEGYWIDHWTYNLDLIENYLAVYPEKLKELLLEDESYTFYDNYAQVQPRDKKYVLTDAGPRQFNAVVEDEAKKEMIEQRDKLPYYVRADQGRGEIYQTTLMTKLLTLVINKVSTLDPFGVGIEMESNKPGWYDALNGLPGIFGSCTAETMELKRLVEFLQESLAHIDIVDTKSVLLPVELYQFYESLSQVLDNWIAKEDSFAYWDQATALREEYRAKVFAGFAGAEEELTIKDLKSFLDRVETKLNRAVKLAREDNGLFTTYFSYQPVEFEKTGEKSADGLDHIRVTEFEQHRLPEFLEGQVRAMKVLEDQDEASQLHATVHDSQLYDQPLGMYRVNGDLSSESYDIGRARAFSPGWLENGSIWLHMEYKYLLELLKSGLYDDFYQAIDKALIPFQDPETYGRSILENSSFILSTLNDDAENHGRGYIARLSGSTAEYLHMWSLMAFGPQPFTIEDGKLVYKPQPALEADLFTIETKEVSLQVSETKRVEVEIPANSFAHRFLGNTLVIYHNPNRKSTIGTNKAEIQGYKLLTEDGQEIEVEESIISSSLAKKIREGEINQIDIFLD
ncbi:hypothetical protein Halha_0262 [Halobacteroides halobius DSM 5150]|uniref:Cellobiose phosphorylase n=1 Tax=Halobacteroides halobius (strain ATCC 35273 / DSM 5150 / MD-1) TaxID=748449 RepID=L0K834_HALHC|nr:hypothetical protein [Halobacteroides halobius]AGB40273.1 hypothetical protein Halha_0262 [Halobacteroides halobius DSM 5150]